GFALVVSTGDNQSAVVATNFGAALAVQLTEKAFGKALPNTGLVVTYTAPTTPPGVNLSAGTATTNASGVASVTARAGTVMGSFVVTASAAGIDSATFHLTNTEVPSLVVNTTQDLVNNTDGKTSLREAIAYAGTFSTPATITFDATVFPAGSLTTIVLAGSKLELANTAAAVTIAGPGAGQVAVSGNNSSGVFVVDFGVTAAINGLTITGGNASSGAGINNAGTLTLQNDVITSNSGGSGGGLFNSGNVTITASSFSSNSAQFGGGLWSSGNVTLTNSTISNNLGQTGGGFFNSGKVTVTGS